MCRVYHLWLYYLKTSTNWIELCYLRRGQHNAILCRQLIHIKIKLPLNYFWHCYYRVERCYVGRKYVRMFVRSSIRASVTECSFMYGEQMAEPRSANFLSFCTCWQVTYARQFSLKSSASLTFNFKVNYSNKEHCEVHTRTLLVARGLMATADYT